MPINDVATLGIQVTTAGVNDAKRSLDDLAASGDRAAASTSRLGQASADAAKKYNSAAYKQQADDLARMIGNLDPASKKLDMVADAQMRLNALWKTGNLEKSAYTELQASLDAAQKKIMLASSGMHELSLNSSMARMEIGRLAKDIATGQWSRFEQSAMTLANYSGVMGKVFSSTGIAIAATTLLVGGFAASLYKAAEAESALQKAIILSGNATGMTADQLKQAAAGYATYYTSASKVLDLEKGLMATGSVNAENFRDATAAAVAFGEATGDSQKEVLKTFDQLAQNPVSTLQKINQLYGWITPAVMDHVKALEDEGNKAEAVAEAFRAIYSAASDTSAAEQQAQSTIDKLVAKWKNGAAAIGGYYEKLVTGASPEEAFQREKAYYQQMLTSTARNSPLDRLFGQVASPDELAAERKKLEGMASAIQAARDAAGLGAQTTEDNKAGNAANAYYDSHFAKLDKLTQKQKELNDLFATYEQMWEHTDNNPRLAGVQRGVDANGKAFFFGGAYDRDVKAIDKRYADHSRTPADPFSGLNSLVQGAQVFDQGADGPKGQSEQVTRILAIVDAGAKLIASGKDIAKAQALVQTGVEALNDGYAKQAATLKDKTNAAVAAYKDTLQDMLQTRQREIDLQVQSIGMGAKEIAQQRALIAIDDEYNKKKASLQRQQQNSTSALAKAGYQQQLDALENYHKQRVAMELNGYAATNAAQENWKLGAISAMENVRDEGMNVAGMTKSLFTSAFNDMGNALANFATTGKFNFRSLTTSILTDLARMEARILESKVLDTLLGAFSGGGSGGSTWGGYIGGNGTGGYGMQLQSANGNAFDNVPGLSAYSGSVVDKPTVFAFAAGSGLMGEAGPEAILPLRRGPDGKLGVAAGGSGGAPGVTINVNVDNSGAATQQTTGNSSAYAHQFAQAINAKVREGIANEQRPGGLLWRMQNA